ncbi:4 TM domain-containing transmembrane protein [Acrasis kona]|uniref:4 TM domain-containing transmembrane protein n=1 Tax=Acrasis kona TaxID=1008807 RepID=A0AAW2ZQE9_9EUKA
MGHKHFNAFPNMLCIGDSRVDIQKLLFAYIEPLVFGLPLSLVCIMAPSAAITVLLPSNLRTESDSATIITRLLGINLLLMCYLSFEVFSSKCDKLRRRVMLGMLGADIMRFIWALVLLFQGMNFVTFLCHTALFLFNFSLRIYLTLISFGVFEIVISSPTRLQSIIEDNDKNELVRSTNTIAVEEGRSPSSPSDKELLIPVKMEPERWSTQEKRLIESEEDKFWREQKRLLERMNEPTSIAEESHNAIKETRLEPNEVERQYSPRPSRIKSKDLLNVDDNQQKGRLSVKSALSKYLGDIKLDLGKIQEPATRIPSQNAEQTDSDSSTPPEKKPTPRLSPRTTLNKLLEERGIALPKSSRTTNRSSRKDSILRQTEVYSEEERFWKNQQDLLKE